MLCSSARSRTAVALLALAGAGCPAPTSVTPEGDGASSGREPPPVNVELLAIAPRFEPSQFQGQASLVARLRRSSFDYFRYIAGPFAQAVCTAHAREVSHMPTVNLHGDVHLEQYAVADDGFGLVDFDDATLGPPVLDWLRFATSVWLGSSGDEESARAAIDRFVAGYEAALADPEVDRHAREPAVAARVRAQFKTSAEEWLNQVSAMVEPMPETDIAKMKAMRVQYVSAMLSQNPDLGESFFGWKGGGVLKMGVGSAHQAKYLVRLEGPTTAPGDDVIVEKKEMKANKLGACTRGNSADPRRVITAQSKFSRSPQRLLGYVALHDSSYYVHAWRVHYTEVGLSDVKTPAELAELAYDVGLQLGRGHPLLSVDSDAGKAEREQIRASLAELKPRLGEEAKLLAQQTEAAYQRFKSASEAVAAE